MYSQLHIGCFRASAPKSISHGAEALPRKGQRAGAETPRPSVFEKETVERQAQVPVRASQGAICFDFKAGGYLYFMRECADEKTGG